jgi:hypothetical protein
MSGCNCGKSAPTGFGSNRTAEQEAQQRAVMDAQSRVTNAAQQQAADSGSTQMSFGLRDTNGRTQRFGSALERNAHQVRHGGTPT